MTLRYGRYRHSFGPKETGCVQPFSVSIRKYTAKSAHYYIPRISSNSLRYTGLPPKSLPSPHSFTKSVDLKQIIFAIFAFPSLTFDYPMPNGARLHKSHIKNLNLIRDTCTSIRVLSNCWFYRDA